jgi:ornithine carbamoyltransferase
MDKNSNKIKTRHFLDLDDFSFETLRAILDLANDIKARLKEL